jgi:hypothetical protein
VDLWLEYCQHSIGGIGTEAGIKAARDVYERSVPVVNNFKFFTIVTAIYRRALTACGLDTGKGSLVWESYRELESALLSLQGW